MLRGNHAAKIDDKGRLKIPNAFRALVEKQHGTELFVTSLTGEYVRLYPMPVWLALEEKLAPHAVDAPGPPEVPRPGELLRSDRRDRRPGTRPHPRPAARVGGDDRRRRRLRADRHARRLEPRAVRRPDAARCRIPTTTPGRSPSSGSEPWPSSTRRCSWLKRWRCSSRRAAACSSTARSASAATAGRCSRPGPRACSASIAMPMRSRWPRPSWPRLAIASSSCTPTTAISTGARRPGHRAHRRRPRRPRRVVDAARRRRARVQLPARRAARHADGPLAPRRRPPICWRTSTKRSWRT